jgi:hypothetical protein
MTDVHVIDQGTLIGFETITETAQDWFRLNVASADWQWMGNTLWVDHRNARDLLDGIVNADLTVEFDQ